MDGKEKKKDVDEEITVEISHDKVSTKNDKKDVDEVEKKVIKRASFRSMLRFASFFDYLLIISGLLTSLLHGASLPGTIVLIGRIIDDFTKHAQQLEKKRLNIPLQEAEIDVEEEISTVTYYALIVVALTFLSAFITNYSWNLFGTRQSDRWRREYFKAILRQDGEWQDQNDGGEATNNLTSTFLVLKDGMGEKFGLIFELVCRFSSGLVFAFYFSWKMALVVLAATPTIIIAGAFKGKFLANWSIKEQEAYAKSGAIAEEVLGAMKTIIAFGAEENELKRYETHLVEAERAGIMKGAGYGICLGIFRLSIFLTYALSFWYGSRLVIDGEIEGGDVLLVFFCIAIGANHVGQVGPYMESFGTARALLSCLLEVVNKVPKNDVFSKDGVKSPIEGNIEFKDVHFSYPQRKEAKILRGVSMSINTGSTIAIVGESGCGKSTIIKLIQSLYLPNDGQIFVDGVSLKDYNLHSLRQQVAVVSQEPVLFDLTIRENILLGKLSATEEEVIEAAKQANAHDFINALPMRYDSHVGEGGAQLSGGQKQRIAIARALIGDPKILLLDEATSALDMQSESVVQAALDKASIGRTTIIVAHRLSTIRNAEKIIVMDKGKIKETGDHEQLMALKGSYYSLIQMHTKEEKSKQRTASVIEEASSLLDQSRKRSLRSNSITSDIPSDVLLELSMQYEKRKLSLAAMHASASISFEEEPEDIQKAELHVDEKELASSVGFWQILKLNSKEWHYILIGSLGHTFIGMLPIGISLYIGRMLQVFASTDNDHIEDEANKMSLMFVFFAVGAAIAACTGNFFMNLTGEKLTSRMLTRTFKKLLYQDMSFFDSSAHNSYALASHLANDTANLKGAAGVRVGAMIEVTVSVFAALILGFISSWQITLLTMCFIPPMIIVGVLKGKVLIGATAETQKSSERSNKFAAEIIANIRTVNAIGKEQHFVGMFSQQAYSLYRISRKTLLKEAFFASPNDALMILAAMACMRLGAYLVARQDIEFHQIFRVFIAILYGAMFAGIALSLAPDYVGAKMSAARILNLLSSTPKIDRQDDSSETKEINGEISLKSVTFSYPNRPDIPILTGLNLKIKNGQSCAVVGTSGGGKSTVIALIQRLYDVATGTVRLGGHDIRSLSSKQLRSHMSVVSQEPTLFRRSIIENILLGLEYDVDNINEELEKKVIEVAKAANIHHFITSLPKGYNTQVGVKGVLLSGGQKQRIAIARALIRDPKLLLLDEATSALDIESEKIVQEALNKAMSGRTSIVVAHRLSTIKDSDLIAVVCDGQTAEQGKHNELLSENGIYSSLYKCQEGMTEIIEDLDNSNQN